MGRYLSGLCVATLGLCAAGWLAFVLRYQPAGAPWTGAARLDVTLGAALAAVGFGGFFTALAGSGNCTRRPAPLRSGAARRSRVCNS